MSPSPAWHTVQYRSEKYYFPPHVFCCFDGKNAVLLDLEKDKYLCVGRGELNSLRPALGDLPPWSESKVEATSDTAAALLRDMLSQGLVTDNVAKRNPSIPTQSTLPTSTLKQSSIVRRARGTERGALRTFLIATSCASALLRWRHLKNTVGHVSQRRSRLTAAQRCTDLKICNELVAEFDRIRPFYPRKYECMFDSLALIEFLSRYNQFPSWVFGVRTDPFAAHCWVQAGDTAFNDALDDVRSFVPIMVV